jgi:hypothetical protein
VPRITESLNCVRSEGVRTEDEDENFAQAVDFPDYNWDLDVGKKERDLSLPGLDVSILWASLAIVMPSGRPQ